MKAVAKRGRDLELWRIDKELWNALLDLQTEVAFTEPAKPPHGDRVDRGPFRGIGFRRE